MYGFSLVTEPEVPSKGLMSKENTMLNNIGRQRLCFVSQFTENCTLHLMESEAAKKIRENARIFLITTAKGIVTRLFICDEFKSFYESRRIGKQKMTK